MMRVDIPLHRRTKIADILRMDSMHLDILAPVVEQLEGAVVEDDHAVLLLTEEECKIAAYVVSTCGDLHSKLCLLFSYAKAVEADVPKWQP
jgi:hypothetical protein